jgi:hypothetical protein
MVVVDERRQMKVCKCPGKVELAQEARHGYRCSPGVSAAMPLRRWPYGWVLSTLMATNSTRRRNG